MTVLNWVGGSSTRFNDPLNWSPHAAPNATSDVTIKPAAAISIASTVDTTINSLTTNAATTLGIAGAFTINDKADPANPAGTSTNAGTINLNATSDLFLFGTFDNTGVLATVSASDLWARGTLDNSGTVRQSGDLHIGAAAAGAVVNSAGAHYTVTGAVDIVSGGPAGGTFTNDGAFVRGGGGSTDVTTAFINADSVTVGAGALNFLGGTTNVGTMTVAGAHLNIAHAISGTGTLDISGGGTLTLGGGSDSGQTVDFMASAGLLALAVPKSFNGTIGGFGTGDTVDLLKTAANHVKFAGGVLSVTNGTTSVASLHLSGPYTTANFALHTDHHGGTLILFV